MASALTSLVGHMLDADKIKMKEAKAKWIDSKKKETYATRCYSLLEEKGPMTPDECVKYFEKNPFRNKDEKLLVRQALAKLATRGVIRKLGHGLYDVERS
tara:strand:+ start:183 stop:482 length:300 start_codon:yes stop_codon:yes gene_type:complete